MFAGFLADLRRAGVPVSLTEYLGWLGALRAEAIERDVEQFYYLARAALVKDERHIDRFDQVFVAFFKGVVAEPGSAPQAVPDEWLKKLAEKFLSPEEMAAIQALGGFEKLMETLRQRLAEQQGGHQGGSKWIGTAGTSPFGAYGYNPEGVRIGQDGSRHRRAVKVWDRREFKDLDGEADLGGRAMKLALRRLRRFARTGAASELDLDGTVQATAANAGSLDVKFRPERHNTVKLLLLLDIGGSMDDHVELADQIFSAAKAEFKHLEHYYFHNCPYEGLWKENRRRAASLTETFAVIRRYPPDWRLVFVGDATMSPYEITEPGGAVEYWNEEAGHVWMRRLLTRWPKAAWINPQPERLWDWTPSIKLIRTLMAGRMYPLTLDGIDQAARALAK